MSSPLERLKFATDVAAAKRLREELMGLSGKALGQVLWHAVVVGDTVNNWMRNDIISECMRRLEAADGEDAA